MPLSGTIHAVHVPRMNDLDFERLAALSDDVRDSTLKRLKQIPVGRENDSALPGMMSPADIAAHLMDSDEGLLAVLDTRISAAGLGAAGQRIVGNREEYDALIETLVRLRTTRRKFILAQDDTSLAAMIPFEWQNAKGEMDLGSMIYRVLDHEAHHRGALAVILRHLRPQDTSRE